MDIVTPDTLEKALEAIRLQVDVVTTLSSGGVAAIIVTWARILGIVDDANLSGFRRPILLVVPMISFVVAVIAGYLISSLTTGYHLEISNGLDASTGKIIESAKVHFFSNYEEKFHKMMSLQLYISISGIAMLVTWYGWNVYKMNGATK